MSPEQETEIKCTMNKGKCLFTRNKRDYGELIYSEKPLFTSMVGSTLHDLVVKSSFNFDADLEFHWYAAAVTSYLSDDRENRDVVVNKWFPMDNESSACEALIAKLGVSLQIDNLDPRELRKHLLAWRYNSFSHHSNEKSLIMYNRTSYMAHSCRPSAAWAFGDEDSFNLRAIRRLDAGAELTISYLSEEQLAMTTAQRREILNGWMFHCECERCSERFDACRSIKCPHCVCGSIALCSDCTAQSNTLEAAACDFCGQTLSSETLNEFLLSESKYIKRAQALGVDDVEEAEQLYDYAQLIFSDHWVLYKIESVLLPHYKQTSQTRYIHLLTKKIKYFENFNFPSYTLAWTLEELADAIQSKALYERAYHVMRAVTGTESGYTTAISEKWSKLSND